LSNEYFLLPLAEEVMEMEKKGILIRTIPIINKRVSSGIDLISYKFSQDLIEYLRDDPERIFR